MEKTLEAVYKDGALHPLDPLQLEEMQRVTVTVHDESPIDEDLAGYFTPEEWALAAHDTITWTDVQHALSGIKGNLSDTVIEQREER